MNGVDVLAELVTDNPSKKLVDLRIFADALATYTEAATNIDKHGAIVMHPRTGAPIDNPYLKVRASAALTLRRMKHVKSDRVMRLLAEQAARAAAAAKRAAVASARRRAKKPAAEGTP